MFYILWQGLWYSQVTVFSTHVKCDKATYKHQNIVCIRHINFVSIVRTMQLTFYRQTKHLIWAKYWFSLHNQQSTFPSLSQSIKILYFKSDHTVVLGFNTLNGVILLFYKGRKVNSLWSDLALIHYVYMHGTDARHWILLRCYMWIFLFRIIPMFGLKYIKL